MLMKGLKSKTFGGVTLEYILVSSFATVASLAALGFMKQVFSQKISELSSQFNIEASSLELQDDF